MNFKYIKVMAMAALVAVASACSDDKWEPGPAVSPDCMTVYFELLNSYDVTVGPDDSRIITVNVGRANYDQAASIPVTVTNCPEGVVVPATIDFEAGEKIKPLYIDVENMAPKTSGTLSVTFPEDMTSPYGAGNPSLDLNITISGAWVLLADDLVTSFASYYNPIYNGELYTLEGTSQFKIPDFCGSGLDFVFSTKSTGNGFLDISPVRNYIAIEEFYGGTTDHTGWFFYDDANDEYPEWSPTGVDPTIWYIEFEDGYSLFDFGERADDEKDDYRGYLGSYSRFSNGAALYFDIFFYFTPKFNPFEAE